MATPTMKPVAEVLIGGRWRPSTGEDTFWSENPRTGEPIGPFPISPWPEIDEALEAASAAYRRLSSAQPEVFASFLEGFADRIEDCAEELVATAHAETALPERPRLAEGELPRTTDQLRQAAMAARHRPWRHPVLSPEARIASYFAPLPGVVCVFGPNNFPFAFNSAAGGDFAAAVATGHPVIAKGNPGHPDTTRIFAREAHAAAEQMDLPSALVQLVYRTSHEDGERMVGDPRVAATAYTGSRSAGLALKTAAETAGNLIYVEMSSVNPVVVLPGAWKERGESLAEELTGSMLAGAGQFCTSPGLIFTVSGANADGLRRSLKEGLETTPSETLLAGGVLRNLTAVMSSWEKAGARVVAQSTHLGVGCSFPNTMMEVDGGTFLEAVEALQSEAFGNLSLLIATNDLDELRRCLARLEGNLTGSIYSASDGSEDEAYASIAPVLRERVGRLLNDKVPTGVAVVPAMNHGGPFPSTGHPGFTAVGIPASLARFATLESFDAVPDHRLPPELQAANPLGLQRCVDGEWTTDAVTWG